MSSNHVLLETIHLTQTTGSITFNNIPQSGYTDLKILMSGRGNGTSFSTQPWQNCSITLNGASNSSAKQFYATSAGTGSDSQANGIWITDPEATANVFSNNEIYLPNYLSSSAKSITVDSVTENNGSDAARVLWSALFPSVTTSVTSITITPVSGSFLENTTFSLYGIAAFGTTATLAPKATGGNIVANDGTYWYHAFLTSGTFTPQRSLTCDYLVVAGGGGGGYDGGGGGGAGGLRSTVTATGGGGTIESALSLLSATNYSVIIGSGGIGSTSASSTGTNGSNSIFSTITSVGGGGGGSDVAPQGLSGGSGGGCRGNRGTFSGGAGTNNQGYAGGGAGSGTDAGGGGGAGAAGQNGTVSTNSGNGGSGVSIPTFAAATNTGVSNFYAGGGGGGDGGSGGNQGFGGSGGGGNGGYGTSTVPTDGILNTGAGGGGGKGSSGLNGANGGSGIIIIRYAI